LQAWSHLGDLVEEDRAAVGSFEEALLETRVRERAALVAEQLASSNCSKAEHVMFMNGLEDRSLA
jgi:hypothetical protein